VQTQGVLQGDNRKKTLATRKKINGNEKKKARFKGKMVYRAGKTIILKKGLGGEEESVSGSELSKVNEG